MTPRWQKLLSGLRTGVILWRFKSQRSGVFGRDVRFALSVRLCDGCDPPAGRGERLRAVLRRTPLYARLLDKYPAATVTPTGG